MKAAADGVKDTVNDAKQGAGGGTQATQGGNLQLFFDPCRSVLVLVCAGAGTF